MRSVSWSLQYRIFWPETLDIPWKGVELWFLCIELTMLFVLLQGMKNPSRKPLITWSNLILNHNLPCYSLHYCLSLSLYCETLWELIVRLYRIIRTYPYDNFNTEFRRFSKNNFRTNFALVTSLRPCKFLFSIVIAFLKTIFQIFIYLKLGVVCMCVCVF